MAFGWGARKNRSKKNVLAGILSSIQVMPSEDVIPIIRNILDRDEPAAEKLTRIGIMLMCLDVTTGTIISDEISNRIQIAYATGVHPSKEIAR